MNSGVGVELPQFVANCRPERVTSSAGGSTAIRATSSFRRKNSCRELSRIVESLEAIHAFRVLGLYDRAQRYFTVEFVLQLFILFFGDTEERSTCL